MIEHFDRIQRIRVEIVADERELLQHVRRCGDDVAAGEVRFENVVELARAGPDQLGAGAIFRSSTAAVIIGSVGRPVSAMRPAKTET